MGKELKGLTGDGARTHRRQSAKPKDGGNAAPSPPSRNLKLEYRLDFGRFLLRMVFHGERSPLYHAASSWSKAADEWRMIIIRGAFEAIDEVIKDRDAREFTRRNFIDSCAISLPKGTRCAFKK